MDVQQAVVTAKQVIRDLFGDEQLVNIGLEEIERAGPVWRVTIGFSRPWQRTGLGLPVLNTDNRSYRVVTLNDSDGTMVSVKRALDRLGE